MAVVGPEWERLMLPTEFEPDRKCVTYRTVTRVNGHVERVREKFWEDPRTVAGELLAPDRFSPEVVASIKQTLGPFSYAGQHQQRPSPEGGGMFRVENWRFWRADDGTMAQLGHVGGARPRGAYADPARVVSLDQLQEQIISVDASFRETKAGSFVAIHVWARQLSKRLLLYRVHRRMDFTDTVSEMLRVIDLFPEARRKLIEGKANGDAIRSTLERTHGITGIEMVDPGTANKAARANAQSPLQAAGNVELPDGAPWLEEYIAEHAAFPNGPHNDDVDAQAQALQSFERPRSMWEALEYADI